MKKNLTIPFIFILLIIIATINGCIETAKIGDLVNNPDNYDKKSLSVEGVVTRSNLIQYPEGSEEKHREFYREYNNIELPEGFTGTYFVRDNSGEILIITKSHEPLPNKNDKITVRGEAISVSGKQYIDNIVVNPSWKMVIMESEREIE